MTRDLEIEAWTRYWQANRIDSCIAGGGEADEADVFKLWAGFLATLPADPAIIDLAAGNGAVALRLLKAAKTASMAASVCAVDLADINPAEFIGGQQETLLGIDYYGGVDISALPFGDELFAGAVSQFGFEYADIPATAAEMLRVLKAGGRFQLLLHHKKSALVAPNVAQIPVIDCLVGQGGVIEKLSAYLAAPVADRAVALASLEGAGEQLVQSTGAHLPRIAQEIFSAVHQLLKRQDLSFDARLKASNDMTVRLKAERERMRQLGEAALGASEINAMMIALEENKAESITVEEFRVGKDAALLGWLVRGQKPRVKPR